MHGAAGAQREKCEIRNAHWMTKRNNLRAMAFLLENQAMMSQQLMVLLQFSPSLLPGLTGVKLGPGAAGTEVGVGQCRA